MEDRKLPNINTGVSLLWKAHANIIKASSSLHPSVWHGKLANVYIGRTKINMHKKGEYILASNPGVEASTSSGTGSPFLCSRLGEYLHGTVFNVGIFLAGQTVIYKLCELRIGSHS